MSYGYKQNLGKQNQALFAVYFNKPASRGQAESTVGLIQVLFLQHHQLQLTN